MAETAIKWLELGLWRIDPLIKDITSVENLMAAVELVTKHPDQIIKAVIGPKSGPVE